MSSSQEITTTMTAHSERSMVRFWIFISLSLILSFLVAPNAEIARWLGFFFASYAAVSNDSIQTLGTFIASNKKRPWWLLWIFTSVVFLATVSYSWFNYDGDVSYQRLASKGFSEAPSSFSFLQVAAPIFLIVLTRFKMPVSTTFLLLTSFLQR